MLSYREMEQYCKLIQVIQGYKGLIDQYDSSLKAKSYESIPNHSAIHAHQLEEVILKKEKAQEKLPRLKKLAETQLPGVEETILAAVADRRKRRIRDEMILRSRYLNGHSWTEIATMLGSTDSRSIENRATQLIRKARGQNEHENDSA